MPLSNTRAPPTEVDVPVEVVLLGTCVPIGSSLESDVLVVVPLVEAVIELLATVVLVDVRSLVNAFTETIFVTSISKIARVVIILNNEYDFFTDLMCYTKLHYISNYA